MDIMGRIDDAIMPYIISMGWIDTFKSDAVEVVKDFLENEGVPFTSDIHYDLGPELNLASFAWIEASQPVLMSFLFEM